MCLLLATRDLICLFLFIWTLNLYVSPEATGKTCYMVWQYVLVWLPQSFTLNSWLHCSPIDMSHRISRASPTLSWSGSCILGLSSSFMPILSHCLPETDWEVQEKVKEVFGFAPCLWQIHVVCTVLSGDNMITIARTGSGKSITYWMPVLFIKYGISVIVIPLKLLGLQFTGMLQDNGISAISIMAANATNELFEVILFRPWLAVRG